MYSHIHVVSFIGAALVLAGCSGQPKGGPVEIVYWTGWSSHELKVQQKLIDEFNSTHPGIHVRIVSQFQNSGVYENVRIGFAGGSTPDVMSTVWAEELADYAKRGVLEPLDPYMKQSGRDFDKEFVPGLQKSLRVDGKVYALAATTGTNFILYNRKLFKDAGLDPNKTPTTLDEFDADAKACTKQRPDGGFDQFGFTRGDLKSWAYVFGGRWFDPVTGKVTANDPHNVAALRWLGAYGKQYDIQRVQAFQSTFGSDSTPNGPFFVGKIAMWSTGEWSEEFVRRYAPGLDYGFFPLPPPPGGRPNSMYVNGSVFVIPTASKHKREAWEFLNWICGPHAVRQFCVSIRNVPSLISVGADPAFMTDPLFRFAVNLSRSDNAVGPPGIAMWPSYVRAITRAEEAGTIGKEDPQKTLDELQTRMEKELARTNMELQR